MRFLLACMYWTYTLKLYEYTPFFSLIHSSFPLLLPHFYLHPCFASPTLLCTSFLPPIAAWTWHRWLGCGAHGRNCPASTRSCLETCRTSSTRPGTWPSTATSWAARACSHPSSHCSQWSRRISPSYTKVRWFFGEPRIAWCAFFCVLATHMLLHFL